MHTRAVFLLFVTLICALAVAQDSLAGKWVGRAPDPAGRTEDVELRFAGENNGLSGILHLSDQDIPLSKVQLQGRNLTFDAPRRWQGRTEVYHFDGTLSGDTLAFTVQNQDGSSFFRFTVHREP